MAVFIMEVAVPAHGSGSLSSLLLSQQMNKQVVLDPFSVAMIRHGPKATWVRKGLQITVYHPPWQARARTQGRTLEAGTEAEIKEACYLLAGFFWLSQLPSLYNPGLPAKDGQQMESSYIS